MSLVTIGARVAVFWDGENAYFRGTVTRQRKKKFFVEYDDGDREWIKLAKHRFRLLKRSRGDNKGATESSETPREPKRIKKHAASSSAKAPAVHDFVEKDTTVELASKGESKRAGRKNSSSIGDRDSADLTTVKVTAKLSKKERRGNHADSSSLVKRRRNKDLVEEEPGLGIAEAVKINRAIRESLQDSLKFSKEPEKETKPPPQLKTLRGSGRRNKDHVNEASAMGIAEAVKINRAIRESLESVSEADQDVKVQRGKALKRRKPEKTMEESEVEERQEKAVKRTKRERAVVREASRGLNEVDQRVKSVKTSKRDKSASLKENKSPSVASAETPCQSVGDWVASYNRKIVDESSDDSGTDEEELMQWAVKMFGIQRPPIARQKMAKGDSNPDTEDSVATAPKKKKKFRRSDSNTSQSTAEKEEEEKKKKELARPLTAEEISTILGEDFAVDCPSTNWVRRSVRQPSKNALNSPRVKDLLEKLRNNDDDMVVLKMKKYVNDPNAPCIVIDAVLDALEENTNCEALYIQVSCYH